MTRFNRRRRELLKLSAVTGGVCAAMPLLPGTLADAEGADIAPAGSANPAPTFVNVGLRVNGTEHQLTLDPRTTLLDALREHLAITGAKKGCDQGACGACTVLADGKRINSCLTLAAMNSGKKIVTIEGLANDQKLLAIQAAFIRNDGFQCGYCTPGQIMAGVACIAEGHAGSPEEIRKWMSGNLCRCGAYDHIVLAIRDATRVTRGG